MPIHAYVTSFDPGTGSSLSVDDGKILATLGTEEEAVAIRLQELFEAVSSAVKGSLEVDGQLTIEITGSIDLKVDGGVKYLFFNAGASAASKTGMKISLATAIKARNTAVASP